MQPADTSTDTAVRPADVQAPPLEATQEVRFAVVMYGGVSLAIYINGVARELFRLVQSTAPERRKAERTSIGAAGTSAVYRKLGQLLENGRLRTDLCDVRDGRVVIRDNGEPPPVRTRFIVDILSGTSAGGINAVYLAKALANDGDFEVLRDLWLEEADIGLLVHDETSHDPLFRTPDVPASLLNGSRMYYKLLDALARVGPPQSESSRLVEELDLFVTATDVRGLPVSITLDDVVVTERRHRNVFRFRYVTRDAGGGADHNDFVPENDAFLAFAARCTSAFPGAFEPMCLADGRRALHESHSSSAFARRADWTRFHRDYEAGDFDARAFQDGGSLDNKPFTHATEALLRRRADLPVDRKLIYIEPSPEGVGWAQAAQDTGAAPAVRSTPDMLENVAAALVGLPRYETIREDLERLLGRNRAFARVDAILRDREEDVRRRRARTGEAAERMVGPSWAKRDLTEMIDEHGVPYGAYHRLKVATVLDDMAELVVRVGGLAPESAEQRGLRRLLEAWKQRRYTPYRDAGGPADTENAFLFHFDLGWWLRRLAFVQEKTGELFAVRGERAFAKLHAALCAHPDGDELARQIAALDPELRASFDGALRRIRHALNDTYVHLRAAGRALRSRSGSPLRRHVEAFLPPTDTLRRLAAARGDTAREQAAVLLSGTAAPMDELAAAMSQALSDAIVPAAEAARFALGFDASPDSAPGGDGVLDADDVSYFLAMPALPRQHADARLAAQRALRFYYDEFEFYDLIAFPILHEAGIGESDIVDVIRVSPLDAAMLVPDEATRSRKLAGTFLSNFGAFFERDWRLNDMVWGRLDAAERIVAALLPAGSLDDGERALRDAVVNELHDAIFAEEGVDRAAHVAGVSSDRRLGPEPTVGVAARASRVLGRVLETIAAAHSGTRALARWPRRGFSMLATLASATVAGSPARRRVGFMIAVAYVAGALLLGWGYGDRAWAFGLGAFTAAGAGSVHAMVAGLRRAVHGRQGALKRAALLSMALTVIAVLTTTYGLVRF
jgi:patatin-related protein